VQRVGPEHFGIVSVDCAKARFKWMLCDFYGKLLVPPTTGEDNRPELDLAVARLQAARQQHDLRDLIVAIERTGRYHHIPSPTPDTAAWGHSPDVPTWRNGDHNHERGWFVAGQWRIL
jgi:hypothetical protein